MQRSGIEEYEEFAAKAISYELKELDTLIFQIVPCGHRLHRGLVLREKSPQNEFIASLTYIHSPSLINTLKDRILHY